MNHSKPQKRSWINIPFSPARFPFFYGWIIVFISTLGMLASIPGQTMGVGVFTDFLIDALNINRVQISTAYMIGTITSSFILPYAGKVLDRIGLRAMSVYVSIGLGASLVLLAYSSALKTAMALNSIIPTLIFIAFVFLFMRFFGQGCLTMVSRVAIGKWFNHHRGLASAISGVFVAVGFNSSPLFLNVLVMNLGWQTASLLLAICVGIGMSLIGWVFFRDNPEQCNLQMDGELSEEKIKKLSAQVPETKKEFTRSEASRTLSFWAFTLGIAMVGLIITAVTFHITSIGAEKGLDRNQSYQVFLWIFPFSIIANFFASWISDRIRHKWILFAMMIAQMISQFGLLSFESFTGRFLFSAGQGCAGGMFVALSNVVYPRFFGREHLGEINGLSMSVLVFASAIGPVLFSGFRNIFGSYQVIFWISIIIPITIILLGLKAENPQLSLKDE